jgi:sulfide:quinone oxidoreductase
MTDLTLTQHSADFATSPQLVPADFAAVAAAGFRSVINNRPDFEGGDQQPASAHLAAAAARAGLRYAYMPVVPSEITPQTVAEFATLMADLPAPILAFCYTGGRAAKLYRLATES